MRKSNEDLWRRILAALDVDAPMDALRDAFAAVVRADEAEHAKAEQRQACATAAVAYMKERHDWATDSNYSQRLSAAILNAGKDPVLKPGMLVKWDGSVTGGRYIQEWSPDDDERFGDKERATLRPLTKAEIMAYADKAPEGVG